jgi:hypothetical protein
LSVAQTTETISQKSTISLNYANSEPIQGKPPVFKRANSLPINKAVTEKNGLKPSRTQSRNQRSNSISGHHFTNITEFLQKHPSLSKQSSVNSQHSISDADDSFDYKTSLNLNEQDDVNIMQQNIVQRPSISEQNSISYQREEEPDPSRSHTPLARETDDENSNYTSSDTEGEQSLTKIAEPSLTKIREDEEDLDDNLNTNVYSHTLRRNHEEQEMEEEFDRAAEENKSNNDVNSKKVAFIPKSILKCKTQGEALLKCKIELNEEILNHSNALVEAQRSTSNSKRITFNDITKTFEQCEVLEEGTEVINEINASGHYKEKSTLRFKIKFKELYKLPANYKQNFIAPTYSPEEHEELNEEIEKELEIIQLEREKEYAQQLCEAIQKDNQKRIAEICEELDIPNTYSKK